MSNQTRLKLKSNTFILFLLLSAVAIPYLIDRLPSEPQIHRIELTASKYHYTPSRIVVNKGDTVIIKPNSVDVTHGFFLDGYDLEFTIKQKGNAYLKYTWEDDDGEQQIDWDRVTEVEFVADQPGKYIYRCFQICGNLHPFMTGELIVKPNGPYGYAVSLSIWLVIALLIRFWTAGDKPPKIPLK